MDPDGQRVDNLDMAEGGEGWRSAQLELGVHEALEAKLYGLSVHRLAIVELGSGSKLELPHGRRHEPGQLAGEHGLDLQVLVSLEQRVEHVPAHIGRG